MEEREETELKRRIKQVVKEKGKRIGDLLEVLDISRPALDKAIKSKHIKLIQLEMIANFLGVRVCELLPEGCGGDNYTASGAKSQAYKNRFDGNFFSGDSPDSVKLKTENELLKQTVERQQEEIEFLRGLVKDK